jgi:hypothetical protein
LFQSNKKRTRASAGLRGRVLIAVFYGLGTLAGIALFVLSFPAGVFNFVPILFYRGLLLLPFAAVLHAALMIVALTLVRQYARRFSRAHLVTVVTAACLVNATFFALVPVNLDRSISVFLLAWMDERAGRPQTKADLEHAFQEIYVSQYRAMDRRLSEQMASGNVVATPDGYRITDQGHTFVAIGKVVGSLFSVDSRFLAPPERIAESEDARREGTTR